MRKPSVLSMSAMRTTASFSASATEMKMEPSRGSRSPAASDALAKASGKLVPTPMTSPVDFISGPRVVSTPGKRGKGRTASLTATCCRSRRQGTRPARDRLLPAGQAQVAQLLAGDDPGGHAGQRHPGGLADEGHRAAAARVDLEHVDAGPPVVALLHRVLHVHEPDHAQLPGQGRGLLLDAPHRRVAQRHRGDDAGRVAGVHARLLDVLHHGADVDVLAVADGVDVDLGGSARGSGR